MMLRVCHLVMGLILVSRFAAASFGEVLVEYNFEGNANDSSGFGLHGELVGDASVEDGRLLIPGGGDNSVAIPLGEFSPFGGETSWTLAFDFQTIDESRGALFSADGSADCEEADDFDACIDFYPDGEETGPQTGSLNVFISGEGTVNTDFWYMDVVASLDVYDDDEVHSYFGSYDAETGEFVQIIDDEDESIGEFIFERAIEMDRTQIADESNLDFGAEFNAEGYNGYIDNFRIDSSGPLPEKNGVDGDFDGNGLLEAADVNALIQDIAAGSNTASFDLNGDEKVDLSDLSVWVKDLRKTWFGDANLDGEFNSTDFVDIFSANKFEKDVDAGWHEGDWSADLRFTSSDFVDAFSDGGYEKGPVVIQAVPEPSTIGMILIGLIGLLRIRK